MGRYARFAGELVQKRGACQKLETWQIPTKKLIEHSNLFVLVCERVDGAPGGWFDRGFMSTAARIEAAISRLSPTGTVNVHGAGLLTASAR